MTYLVGAVMAASASACVGTYQSARAVPPGQVEATLAVTTSQAIVLAGESGADTEIGWVWIGGVDVRRGFGAGVDAGVHGSRAQMERGRAATLAGVSLKRELLSTPKRTLSVDLPVSVAWGEDEDAGYVAGGPAAVVTPALLGGLEVRERVELVGATRVALVLPGTELSNVGFAASVGVRVVGRDRTWAIHPEVGILHLLNVGRLPGHPDEDDVEDDETFIMFGLAASIGG